MNAWPVELQVDTERNNVLSMTSYIRWIACIAFVICYADVAGAQEPGFAASRSAAQQPWMNRSLDADTRADLMIHEMTLDEKIQLVHGVGWGVLRAGAPVPPADNGGAGFVPGIARLHLPDINLADSAVGVRMAALEGRYQIFVPIKLGQ